MSPARIIILLVALAAGLGAAFLVQKPSQAPAPVAKTEPAPTVPVLVAAGDIPIGNTVSANDMRWLDWPLASVPRSVRPSTMLACSIMGVFVVQGALVGVIGTLSGLLLGLGVAFNIDTLVPALEQLLGASFLPQDIYLISRMPSDPQSADIVPIAVISLVLAFAATLYPSWRASRVNPAEALRYE